MPDSTPGTSSFQAAFGNMTDSQLRQTINQLSTAAAQTPYGNYRPAPTAATGSVFEPKQWSVPSARTSTRTRTRTTRANGSSTPQPQPPPPPAYVPPIPAAPTVPALPSAPPNPPRPPIPTTPQALHTTYSSRLRTGTTLLMQPILATTTNTAAGGRTGTRRGGIINYAEPGSGDELDAGAIDTDDSDFVASGGTRSALRSTKPMKLGVGGTTSTTQVFNLYQPPTHATSSNKHELDKPYLGQIPPSRFITAKRAIPTLHEYPPLEQLRSYASKSNALVPIRVELETDNHRIRDCFVWNVNEKLITPEAFARVLCVDLDLPASPWAETITAQIRAQIEEHEGVASVDLGSGAMDWGAETEDGESVPECRIDVQIATYHLLDHIEWDLLSPLTPEEFAIKLCADIGLTGEAVPLISHAMHEEILKHKKDALEWGVIGVETASTPAPPPVQPAVAALQVSTVAGASAGSTHPSSRRNTPVPTDSEATDKPLRERERDRERDRDRSGLGLMKDKTGLGLGGWGRTPKDGRGPKPLRSVWKDWNDAEEFATKFSVLTAEEVERREVESERASRRLRRETSKFQHLSTRRRR